MSKVFGSLLTSAAVCFFVAADSAMASPWLDWLTWIRFQETCSTLVSSSSVRDILDKAQNDFAGFLDLRRKVPGKNPPAFVDPLRRFTSLHEVFYGFTYWWVPGNEWHALMMKNYSRLGLFMQTEARHRGIQIPQVSQKPQIEGSFRVPHSL